MQRPTRRLVRPATLAPRLGRAPRRAIAPPPASPASTSPIIKWVGGKSKLLGELVLRLPPRHERYFEPFAGGAALFFHLAPARAVLADLNPDLIAMYQAVAADPAGLIRRLGLHRDAHDQAHYYQVRERWNDRSVSWSAIDRAAAFVYLNRTCFNGLWRVNRSGAFNVPMGRYTNPLICDPDGLGAAAAVLARADVRCADYRRAVADAGPGDLVYFDPPYDPLTPTANFTSYTGDGFGPAQQAELADTVRALAARGCHVLVSNSDTPRVRALYKGLRIDRVRCPRAINSDAARRGEVDEVIVVAGPAPRAARRALAAR
ncbi:MAG TPA: DNA adenine methylase [Kofleriaceae bacterium]|nr:DNA adenine methylase [Kofleriaceae bacterium]